jgi:ribosomal protein L16/L10AE
VVEVEVKAEGVEAAKRALKVGASKLPTPCTIQIASLQRG